MLEGIFPKRKRRKLRRFLEVGRVRLAGRGWQRLSVNILLEMFYSLFGAISACDRKCETEEGGHCRRHLSENDFSALQFHVAATVRFSRL
ncbi:MAG: hypothetical protein RJB38_1876 [Pseudomonadota bacterium]